MNRNFEFWPKIAALRAQGKTYTQIAIALEISYESVNYHVVQARRRGNEIPSLPIKRYQNAYYGDICANKHDYNGTGKSLRKKGRCVDCDNENQQRIRERKKKNSVNTTA